MVDDLCRLTAATLSAKLRDGEITAEQLARACLGPYCGARGGCARLVLCRSGCGDPAGA